MIILNSNALFTVSDSVFSKKRECGGEKGQIMSQINEALEGLIQAIWEGEEYKRYQEIRAKVHEQPELEQRIHAFRKKNYEVQNRANERALYDQVDGLEREGIEFRKDPLVNEYLNAELGICRLFQRINWELVQNMDFDLGFVID